MALNENLAVKPALLSAVFVVLTFVIAGRWDYWQGWVYNGLNIGFMAASYVVLRDRKDLMRERQKPGAGMKDWDRAYYAVSSLMFFVMFAISVLDAGRFLWLPRVPSVVAVTAGVIYAAGQLLVLWAKTSNRFFSSVVRIQADRNQTVCRKGPYRLVRHPGYLGGSIANVAAPLLLGSYWGLIPAALLLAPMILRTYLEDKTLHEELAGYRDYALEVPFRLVPHVW
jgi:protein-S-isoprenylcysteine O-methyltransferase Ste14